MVTKMTQDSTPVTAAAVQGSAGANLNNGEIRSQNRVDIAVSDITAGSFTKDGDYHEICPADTKKEDTLRIEQLMTKSRKYLDERDTEKKALSDSPTLPNTIILSGFPEKLKLSKKIPSVCISESKNEDAEHLIAALESLETGKKGIKECLENGSVNDKISGSSSQKCLPKEGFKKVEDSESNSTECISKYENIEEKSLPNTHSSQTVTGGIAQMPPKFCIKKPGKDELKTPALFKRFSKDQNVEKNESAENDSLFKSYGLSKIDESSPTKDKVAADLPKIQKMFQSLETNMAAVKERMDQLLSLSKKIEEKSLTDTSESSDFDELSKAERLPEKKSLKKHFINESAELDNHRTQGIHSSEYTSEYECEYECEYDYSPKKASEYSLSDSSEYVVSEEEEEVLETKRTTSD